MVKMSSPSMYLELARRGVLDPYEHIIRKKGGVIPSPVAKQIIWDASAYAIDRGLLKRTAMGVLAITDEGHRTLQDWDDPAADGLYAR